MNTFTLLTVMGGLGAVLSFFSGLREMAGTGPLMPRSRTTIAWRMVFDMAVFLTILAAPLAR